MACFFKTKIFSLEKLYEKREGFLWADVTIFWRGREKLEIP